MYYFHLIKIPAASPSNLHNLTIADEHDLCFDSIPFSMFPFKIGETIDFDELLASLLWIFSFRFERELAAIFRNG